jgi:hypothetical protein
VAFYSTSRPPYSLSNYPTLINSGLVAGGSANGPSSGGGDGLLSSESRKTAHVLDSGQIIGGNGSGSGSGGAGILMHSGAIVTIEAGGLIAGGTGGSGLGGGQSSPTYNPGGAGGIGIELSSSGNVGRLVNDATIIGGMGGAGASSTIAGYSGAQGGVGGYGVESAWVGFVTNYGLIEGGGGGAGGSARADVGGPGQGGSGGVGGAGVLARSAVFNRGTIIGGDGGGGSTGPGDAPAGPAGATGDGVVLMWTRGSLVNGDAKDPAALIEGSIGVYASPNSTATITNFGIIEGTVDSVKFASTADVLIAASGAQFIGPIAGGGGGLVLATGTGSISGLGAGGTLSGADSGTFAGFGAYVIGQGGRWTVTGPSVLSLGQSLTDDGVLTVDNSLWIKSGATIVGAANGRLAIDTGTHPITNSGLIEASGAGQVVLRSAIQSGGTLEAAGGTLIAMGAVGGAGHGVIASGELVFSSTFNQNVTFSGSTGALELAHSQSYTAVISGFSSSGGTALDLADIAFVSAGQATFSGGVLTVTDGTHTAHIHLAGNYAGSTFTASSDGHGGTTVVDPAAAAAQRFIAASASMAAPPASPWPAHEHWRATASMLTRPSSGSFD